MKQKEQKKQQQYAVIGAGRFGTSIATSLYDMGKEVLLIDNDPEKVDFLAQKVTHALVADVTDTGVLERVGVKNFDVVIVAIASDMQTSILTTMMLKDLGVPYIIAKAQSEVHGKILARVGADRILFPERDMGQRLARQMASGNFVESIELSSEYSIVEIHPPFDWIGKSLMELDIRKRFHLNVIATRSKDGTINAAPDPTAPIRETEVLFVIGANDKIKAVAR